MSIPTEMKSLAIPAYAPPSQYDLATLPTPTITTPTSVLIKVHAASFNPGDTKSAAGNFKLFQRAAFPLKLAYDLSGIVVAVGAAVTHVSVGDEVYTQLPLKDSGAASEYAVTNAAHLIALKPRNISHVEAAALPCVGATALTGLRKANALAPLAGKTVFVPAGLSGTGSIAVQLAKHVFGAAKVITTVSTGKVARVAEMVGAGTVDQVVDYVTQDVLKEVEPGSVDFYYDTVGACMGHLPLLKKGGMVMSISNVPRGEDMKKFMPETPWLMAKIMDFAFWVNGLRVGRWGASWDVGLLVLQKGDLEELRGYVEDGKVKAAVGKVARLEDIEVIREECEKLRVGKGGIGKFVVQIA